MDHPSYRVTILVHSLNHGGAQLRLVTIANGLFRRGVAVRFVAICNHGSAGGDLDPGIPLVALKGVRRPKYRSRLRYGLQELRRELKANRPDVLLSGVTTVHGVADRAVRALPGRLRPRLVLRASRHMQRDMSHRNLAARLSEPIRCHFLRKSYRRADCVIAVAEDVAAPIRAIVPDPSRVTVIPNPVIDDKFGDSLSSPLSHPWTSQDRRHPLVLAIGRLELQKGFDILLNAFALLVKRRPARLVILGDGKRKAALEEQRAALGLNDLVDLHGYEAAVAPWLARADLQVSSSRFEGASAALVEGLAAGCPLVVSDCPGNSRTLVEESRAGLVVPVGDPVALADAMERALSVRWDREAIRAHAAPFQVDPAVDKYHRTLCALRRSARTNRLRSD